MKSKLILTLVLSVSMFTTSLIKADGLNENLEKRIHDSFSLSVKDANPKSLNDIIEELKANNSEEAKYWMAYTKFKTSIYYLTQNNKKEAENAIDEAIELLDEIKKKTSEDHALLSACIGFSIQFSPFKAPYLGSKASNNAEKAIKLDENNIRGYLALARGDYYKPKIFGGGDLVEENILIALNKPQKSKTGNVPPSWGRNELFLVLTQFYKREKRKTEAILYCKKGLAEFENDFQLKEMAKKLDINISK